MERQLKPRNKCILHLFLLLCFCCLSNALSAQQQLLGIYEFQGKSTNETKDDFSSVSKQQPFINFSNFSRHLDYVFWATGDNVYNNRSWGLTTAFDLNEYIEFTVSAGVDYKVHISTIAFDHSRSDLGPKSMRIASNNGSPNFDKNFSNFDTDIKLINTRWDGGEVIIDYGKSVTFRIYGWNAEKGTGTFRVDNVAVYGTVIPNIRINEFHYATSGTPQTDFVEVIVPKSFTNYASVKLSVYNYNAATGSGTFVQSETLDKFLGDTTLYDDYNVLYLNFPDGLPDPAGGLALSSETDFIQFLSYGTPATEDRETGMEAVDGPSTVAGKRSTDVGVTEAADDGADNSIFLPESRIQVWTNNESGVNTKGLRNGADNIILPVELTYFRSNKNPQGVLLTWATATEKDNDKFIVERSNSTETNFNAIAEVKGQGSTFQEQKYEFLDKEALVGTTYYRLKQIDYDGTSSYSNIIAVTNTEVAALAISPNPVYSNMRVTYQVSQSTAPVQLLIYSITGARVYRKEYINNYTTNAINLSLDDLPAGTYLLVLITDGKKQTERFVKR